MSNTRKRKRAPAPRAICAGVKGPGLCQHDAGFGTDHPGVGRCKYHGGNTPAGVKAAGVTIGNHLSAEHALILTDGPVMGIPERMAPADALLWCVAIAAGEVRYLTGKVAALDEKELFRSAPRWKYEGGKKVPRQPAPEQLHVYVRERQLAVDRLARLSKMALDAGVAERLVALAEFQATALADLISRVMDQVKLTAAQRARLEPVLERELLVVESGQLGAAEGSPAGASGEPR